MIVNYRQCFCVVFIKKTPRPRCKRGHCNYIILGNQGRQLQSFIIQMLLFGSTRVGNEEIFSWVQCICTVMEKTVSTVKFDSFTMIYFIIIFCTQVHGNVSSWPHTCTSDTVITIKDKKRQFPVWISTPNVPFCEAPSGTGSYAYIIGTSE